MPVIAEYDLTNGQPPVPVSMTEKERVALIRARPDIWLEAFGRILDKNRALVAPRLNPLQRRMVAAYLWCRQRGVPCRMIVLKPRQKGSSTGSVGLAYTHLRNYNAAGVFIGDEYTTTDRLVTMFNRYAAEDRFTAWGSEYDSVKRRFTHGSELEKETAGDKNAGRGGTFQVIVGSEVAHWPNEGVRSAQTILLSLLQVQPQTANTLTVLESTPNGAVGEFYSRWGKARWQHEHEAGDTGNGYIRIFAAWFEFEDSSKPVTERERVAIETTMDEEEAMLVAKYGVTVEQLAWRRSMIGSSVRDAREFDQEYPKDPETCFIASGNPRFSTEGIYRQERLAIHAPPLLGTLERQEDSQRVMWVPTDPNEAVFQLWEHPVDGCEYLMAADTMTGASQTAGARDPDAHAVQVWRKAYVEQDGTEHPLRMVCSVLPPSRVDPDVLMEMIELLSRYYGWCICAPEINNTTGIVEELRRRGVPIYKRRRMDKVKADWDTKWGWQTTESSRRDMIDNLAKWIRSVDENGKPMMECHCKLWIAQAKNFVIKANGRAEANDGSHDDEILASAIALKCIETQSTTYHSAPVRAVNREEMLLRIMRRAGRMNTRGAEVA